MEHLDAKEHPAALEDRRTSTPIGGTGTDIVLYRAVSPGLRPFDEASDKLITDDPQPDLNTMISQDGQLTPPPPPA